MPLYFHNPQGGRLVFWITLPRLLLGSLLWPAVVCWVIYLHFALDLKSIDPKSKEGLRQYTAKLARHAADNSFATELLASAFIILVLTLAVLAAPTRKPILVWLVFVWIATPLFGS